MKIFTADQIRKWDKYTIDTEEIASIELMERAAKACFDWLDKNCGSTKNFLIFCGTGNNGGDGLVVARLLHLAKYKVQVYVLDNINQSPDFIRNLDQLKAIQITIFFLKTNKDFPIIEKNSVIIDALFGTGFHSPLKENAAQLIHHINASASTIISIDIPGGLSADACSGTDAIIKANHTLSFEVNKLAFFLPENALFTGAIHLIKIGLHHQYYTDTQTNFESIDKQLISQIYKPRNQYAHKYNFGHALIYAGSTNMMGAAILCTKACLRSGAGLVTINISFDAEAIIHSALPEAITATADNTGSAWIKKSAIAVGPGMEINLLNKQRLKRLITRWDGPLVIDASALQSLPSFIDSLQTRTNHPAVLTPHKGEFEKLFGKSNNDFETLQLATKKAIELKCFIVLKGHHTLIACPDGKHYFNTTGNAGMATAGSGDTLTGLLCGLLAQGYGERDACILGVYLHGLAGDIAAEKISQEAMIASDITACFGEAFKQIKIIGEQL